MVIETVILGEHQIAEAAEILRRGQLVAFPTETVYGLGADALNEEAVQSIFTAKGRPADNPLIVHCYDRVQIGQVARTWPKAAEILMDEFWPGPLTLVLPKRRQIPDGVTAGLDTVALRVPDHTIARALIEAAGSPLAAPSANISGRPSPTIAAHVWEDLAGRIAAILDGGPTGWGVESTVVDCTVWPFQLLRPGGVTLEEMNALPGIEVDFGSPAEEKPRSPGMKYRHYSPQARVFLVSGEKALEKISDLLSANPLSEEEIGVMAFSESKDHLQRLGCRAVRFLDMGSRDELSTASARIYHLLRQADHFGLKEVYVEGIPENGLGLAIMNRLSKAAGSRVIAAAGGDELGNPSGTSLRS